MLLLIIWYATACVPDHALHLVVMTFDAHKYGALVCVFNTVLHQQHQYLHQSVLICLNLLISINVHVQLYVFVMYLCFEHFAYVVLDGS